MVNATVDNLPVSIVLGPGQSTTVPSNETWRVSVHLANSFGTDMTIDGIGIFTASVSDSSGDNHYNDVTLVGGQTIAETSNAGNSAIFITGFVVDS